MRENGPWFERIKEVMVLGARSAEEEDEFLQQEMHDLEGAAEEENERLQQEVHDLEEAAEEEEERLQQEMHDLEEIDGRGRPAIWQRARSTVSLVQACSS